MPSRITLRLLFVPILLGWLLPAVSQAQEPPDKPEARKFDEFSSLNLSYTKFVLDGFAIELQNNPEAKGYLVVYRSRRDVPGLSARVADRLRRYLVYSRQFSGDRIVAVDAGPSDNLVQELWIAPAGSTPKIRSDAYTLVVPDRTAVRLFDDYFYYLAGHSDEEGPDDPGGGDDYPGGSISAFAAALREEPTASAYVIVYPEYRVDKERGAKNRIARSTYLDPSGTSTRMRNGVLADLNKEYGIARSRIKLINGGYRRQRSVELWIVPAGEHPPIATPNAFPRWKGKRIKANHVAEATGLRNSSPAVVTTSKNHDPRTQATARMFDEFGDIQVSDKKARLDNFGIELQNNPTAKGLIILYAMRRDLLGFNARLLYFMRNYLVTTRGIGPGRIETINAGVSANLRQQLWIVPAGAARPRLDHTYDQDSDSSSVRKFDDYYYGMANNYQDFDSSPEYPGDPLPAFAEAIRQEPKSLAHIIVYPEYFTENWTGPRRIHQDRAGTAQKMLKEISNELTKTHGLPASRIRLVNGGYRNQRSAELWIVPAGEHPPIATPNAFPPKKRSRR